MNNISTTQYFKDAWKIVKANFFKIVGAAAVLFVIQTILDSVSNGNGKNGMTTDFGFLSLLAMIVSLVLGVAVTSAVLKIVRGAPVEMKALTITPKQVLAYVGVVVVLALIALLFVIPVVSFAFVLGVASFMTDALTYNMMIFLGILAVALLALIYINIRLSFATYLVVDGKAGVVDAIKKSWTMTRGKVWFLVVFGLLALLVTLAGVIALLVGLLVAIPVVTLAAGLLYVSFFDGQAPVALETKE